MTNSSVYGDGKEQPGYETEERKVAPLLVTGARVSKLQLGPAHGLLFCKSSFIGTRHSPQEGQVLSIWAGEAEKLQQTPPGLQS